LEKIKIKRLFFGPKNAESLAVKILSVKLTPFKSDHDFDISTNYFFNLSFRNKLERLALSYEVKSWSVCH
jgi:hypothetical protein